MVHESDRWIGLIESRLVRRAIADAPPVVRALTPILRLRGVSRAVVVDCDDGRQYALKGSQVMRALVAEHMVGRLAGVIAAPVPEVQLVEVPEALTTSGSLLDHFKAGMGNGSLYVVGCEDSRWMRYLDEEENQDRFAALAVLFGWMDAEDRQFLYAKSRPHLVFSVDHGGFFPGGGEWTADSLRHAPAADIDRWLATESAVGTAALRAAVERLARATDAVIAEAVTAPPDDWGVTLDERLALAQYLARRRDDILGAILS